MSDKETKLAAARKRAEALKAKKAAEKLDSNKTTDSDITQPNAALDGGDRETETSLPDDDPAGNDNDELKEEIDRLQKLLDESNTQHETLRKEMKAAENKAKESEKILQSRVADFEASLARRDDQVHSLELEISKLRQECEKSESLVKDEGAKYRQLEQEKDELLMRMSDDDATDSLQKKLEAALTSQASAEEKAKLLEGQLSEGHDTVEALQRTVVELEKKHSSYTGEQQSRAQELQVKSNALQSENESLLTQLSELRTHLISTQDEKFALAESIERLQKDLKEAKTNKNGYRSSLESSRTRASRDFDRSVALQEVPLEDKAARDTQKVPAELKSNIQIDLTSWYDKNAGEVIEV